MTRDDIIRMAHECGILMRSHEHQEEPTKLERFAAFVAAAEREACARVCDERAKKAPVCSEAQYEADDCAAAIRARGEK
jgi:hypothetical protein